jgi:hypothetical protein
MTIVILDETAPQVTNVETLLKAWLDYGQPNIKVPNIEIITAIQNLERSNRTTGEITYRYKI